jgi:DNA-binding GntR family transcriptional regulator
LFNNWAHIISSECENLGGALTEDPGSDLLSGLEVQLESTAEQVAGVLRDAIVGGRIAQGTYLREVPLSTRFGVSRNTIREATQILVGEGLVTREMHRGAFVSRVGEADVRDLYRVRRMVELEAVRDSASRDLSGLREAVRLLAEAVDANDRKSLVEHDLLFHSELVDSMGSSRLGGLFDSVAGELRLCLSLVGGTPYEESGIALREHTAILEALEAGNAAEAKKLLAAHLDDAERGLIDVLRLLDAEGSAAAAAPEPAAPPA